MVDADEIDGMSLMAVEIDGYSDHTGSVVLIY